MSADHKFNSPYLSHPTEAEIPPIQQPVDTESLPAITPPVAEDLPQPSTSVTQPEELSAPANTDPLVDSIPSEINNAPTPSAETERTSGNKLPLALRRLLPHNKAGRREN